MFTKPARLYSFILFLNLFNMFRIADDKYSDNDNLLPTDYADVHFEHDDTNRKITVFDRIMRQPFNQIIDYRHRNQTFNSRKLSIFGGSRDSLAFTSLGDGAIGGSSPKKNTSSINKVAKLKSNKLGNGIFGKYGALISINNESKLKSNKTTNDKDDAFTSLDGHDNIGDLKVRNKSQHLNDTSASKSKLVKMKKPSRPKKLEPSSASSYYIDEDDEESQSNGNVEFLNNMSFAWV